MLPRANRLKNTKEIERVFKGGRSLKEGSLFLKSTKNGLGVTRFAFIVSQKISNKAVHRNKIKRRLREAVKNLLPQIKIGLDVAIVAQGGIGSKNFPEIKRNTEKILKKAGII